MERLESDDRSPVKTKKPKSFKFLHKKDKEKDERDKEEKKEERRKGKEGKREEKKKEREKEKEEKLRAKEAKKRSKKDKKKQHIDPYVEDSACMVFGVPLSVAVDRSPTIDGIRLPLVVRQCIDYIEEFGLDCEGIYRLSGVKSKVQQLRRAYNSAAPVCLEGQDPHVVASLLKQFLRELPEPVLTVDMTAHFEDASQIPGWRDRAEAIRQLLHRLPTPNNQLVHYILAHMGHIIDREAETKMNYQNVCIVLSPTMRISHRVLNVFFQNHAHLFGDVVIKRYVSPVSSSSAVEGVQGLAVLQQEVVRVEALLAHLHRLLAASPHNTVVQERLWEAQRILTLLKRKVKMCHREELREEGSSEESQRESLSDATNNSTSLLTTASDSMAPPPPPHHDTAGQPPPPHHDTAGQPPPPPHHDTAVQPPSPHHDTAVQPPPPHDASAESAKDGVQTALPDTEAAAAPTTPPAAACNNAVVSEETEQRRAKDATAAAATRRSSSQQIPKLPKPVSARGERSKMCYANNAAISKPKEMTSSCTTSASGIDSDPFSREAVDNVAVINVSENSSTARRSTDAASGITDNNRDQMLPITSTSSNSSTFQQMNKAQQRSREPQQLVRDQLQPSHNMDDQHSSSVCVDAELVSLVREEAQHLAHHAELLAMNHDLSRKLHAERAEIARLRDEIQEMQTIYGYRTYSYDSSESGGESESGCPAAGESDTEEEELLHQLQHHNNQLQRNNGQLIQRIQEEREAVVLLKARLRQSQAASARLLPHQPAGLSLVN